MVLWIFGAKFVRIALAGGIAVLSVGCVEKRNRAEAMAYQSSSAAASSNAPKTGDVKDSCASICERSHVLRCTNADQCLVNCVGAGTGTPCNAEFLAFYQCLVPQPIANWECAEDGVAAIKPGICNKEQERAVRCMESKAQP